MPHPDFDRHELVTTRAEFSSGLDAIIAVHNTRRGPAIGGCRIMRYESPSAAMKDALRLSRGMTYKCAIADIPYGGGKAVIVADPRTQKTDRLLHAFADFVESLGGKYITSFDSGTTLDDIRTMSTRTQYASGVLEEAGNASESTALGILYCMKAAASILNGSDDLAGMKVAVQGVGNVGSRLAGLLKKEDAQVSVADVDEAKARELATITGATLSSAQMIHHSEVDILSPCALGGTLCESTIGEIRARAVVGGANNQLATPADAQRLQQRGILYCPDYLANAGGIIDLHYQRSKWDPQALTRHLMSLGDTFRQLVDRARSAGLTVSEAADELARSRFAG